MSVGHRPAGPWEFDRSVVDVFEDMLPRSIPGYAEMRRVLVETVARSCSAHDAPSVLDVGASLGGVAKALRASIPNVSVLGVDNSPDMVTSAALGQPDGCAVVLRDVVEDGLPCGTFDAVVWCLTLQFLPTECRPALLKASRARVAKRGGVVFVCEKVQGETPESHQWMTDAYHRRKIESGYSAEDVAAKAASLRWKMATLTEAQNVAMFRAAGFDVQPVWRTLCFAAWALIPREPRDG